MCHQANMRSRLTRAFGTALVLTSASTLTLAAFTTHQANAAGDAGAAGAWCVVGDSGRLGALTVERGNAQTWRWKLTVLDSATLTPDSAVTLYEFAGFSAPLDISARRLPDGRWAIVESYLPGGARASLFALAKTDLFPGDGLSRIDPVRIDGLRLVRQGQDEKPAITDVSVMRVLEHDGRTYLVGESYDDWLRAGYGPNARVTWIARAEIVDRVITGRIIARGESPHVAELGDRTVVTVQVPQPRDTEHPAWGKWIRTYVSGDLEKWEPFPHPPDDLGYGDFDVCVTRDGLTLVAVADTKPSADRVLEAGRYHPALAMVTLVYDPRSESWDTIGSVADKALSDQTEVKLVRPEAVDGRLMLIERCDDGRFTMRSPLE